MNEDHSLDHFKAGTAIYGDDLTQAEINEWFADEAEGYAGIVPEEHKDNFNEYEAITEATLYRYLRDLGNKKWKILSYGGVRNRTSSHFGYCIRHYSVGTGREISVRSNWWKSLSLCQANSFWKNAI